MSQMVAIQGLHSLVNSVTEIFVYQHLCKILANVVRIILLYTKQDDNVFIIELKCMF